MNQLLYTLCLLFSAVLSMHGQASFFDPTFGSGGKTILSTYGSFEAVALQPDGKIIAVGGVIARFKQNGSLDTTFATNGVYNLPVTYGGLYDVMIQPDGKILAAGSDMTAGSKYLAVRLNTDGSPDYSFGSGGVITIDFGLASDNGYALALQADGKIIVAGQTLPSNIGVVRLLTNGIVDSSFGTNGIEKSVFCSGVGGVAVTSDGKIVVGGTAPASKQYKIMAVRYLSDGSLDPTFNGTGVVYTQAGDLGSNFGRCMKLQPDDKILVGGSGGFGGEGSNFVVVRYNMDGSLDASFGSSGGIADFDLAGEDDDGLDLSIDHDGRILMTGITGPYGHAKFAVACLTSAGVTDYSFGDNGKILNDIGGIENFALCGIWQPDGKVIIGGFLQPAAGIFRPVMLRYFSLANAVIEERASTIFTIFPNPAKDKLFIKPEVAAVVSPIIAAVFSDGKRYTAGMADDFSIDVSNWPQGLYFFSLTLKDGSNTNQKIFIEH